MNDAKYIGLDVHQATISAAVLDSTGKLVMECILETKGGQRSSDSPNRFARRVVSQDLSGACEDNFRFARHPGEIMGRDFYANQFRYTDYLALPIRTSLSGTTFRLADRPSSPPPKVYGVGLIDYFLLGSSAGFT